MSQVTAAVPSRLEPTALEQRLVPRRGAITWRSALLGLCAAIGIATLSPYNDMVLENGAIAAGSMPSSILIMLFVLVVAVNAPLHRFAPRYALSAGEIGVAISMALASCTVPFHGLLRFMIPGIVMPLYEANEVPEFRQLFIDMGVPDWLYPDFGGAPRSDWFRHPLVQGFHLRWNVEGASPYAAWTMPFLTWGIFCMAMYGALLGIVGIVHRQWIENERLAFPLAQVQMSLIEPPAPGRALNHVLSRRSFWIALAFIFAFNIWNGLVGYFPRYFPKIPMDFDLRPILGDRPFTFIEDRAKFSALGLGGVAISFFIPTTTVFSLWFFFLAMQVYRMIQGTVTGDGEMPGLDDQHFGSGIAFVLMIIYIGRHHWRLVLAQAFRGVREGEPQGRYLSYRFAFWLTALSLAIMVGWFYMAGSTILGAMVSIGLLVMLMVLIARVVADTGLSDAALNIINYRPMVYAQAMGWGKLFPVKDFFLNTYLAAGHFDTRETLTVFGTHATKIADQSVYNGRASYDDDRHARRIGKWFIALLFLAVLVSYSSGFYAHLWAQYNHAVTLREPPRNIDTWGAFDNSRWFIVQPTADYARGMPPTAYNRGYNFGFGFAFTAFLAFMRLHFAWWPLNPVGYLLVNTSPIRWGWFSFLVGWVLKVLVIRFGGARMYTNIKPFLIGIIVGEALSAIFWLATSFILVWLGIPFRTI